MIALNIEFDSKCNGNTGGPIRTLVFLDVNLGFARNTELVDSYEDCVLEL